MNYLLDTCVLSEYTRRKPETKVIQWVDSLEEEKLFVSAITIGEIQYGVERIPESHRKTELLFWLNNELVSRFNHRILSLDSQTMLIWGSLRARMDQSGQRMAMIDSLIIATAIQHSLIIATRNVTDFLPCGAQVINPWD